MTRFLGSIPITLLALALLFPTGKALATTWHVPTDVPTISSGLAAASSGDTVSIACGTYLEFDLTMKAGVTLQGETSEASCVIIDAQNQGRILDCNGLVELARIENISFTGGYVIDGWLTALGGGVRCQTSNVAITNCVFQDNSSRIGAGFGASESSIELTNCVFTMNNAIHSDWSAGGAVWARGCIGTIENCQVISNTAFSENPDNPGDGGGFFFNNSHLNVSNCLFRENSTGAGAGGFYSVTNDSSIFFNCEFESNSAANGGGVYCEFSAAPQLINCTFTNNIAQAGGALVSFNDSQPTIIDCLFENNQATLWGGGAIDAWSSEITLSGSTFRNNNAQTSGGAANFGGSTAEVTNCVFTDNTAVNDGGALRCHYSSLTALGCTLVGNSASNGAGIYCGTNASATVDHTIIAFSPYGESMAGLDSGFATIMCSDFFGNSGGDWVGDFEDQLEMNNNFSADPLFCNPDQNNYSLDTSSPCAPESQEVCGLVGALPTGCSISAIPNNTHRPSQISAVENYPNPFNPSTTISFSLSQAAPTQVVIFDMAGHLVRTLIDEQLPARNHHLEWSGRNDHGQEVAAGIYFFQIISGTSHSVGRMALIK